MLWVFDINETLLDLAALDAVFAEHVGTATARTEWFDLMIRDALVVAATGDYRDFAKLGAACAAAVADAHGHTFTDTAAAALADTMRSLPAHPDVPEGLATLRERGHRLVALGNSPEAVVRAQLENAGLTPLLDGSYSAEQAGALKPAAAPYRMVLSAERTEPDQAVMVAAHDWDIAGAHAVGMRTVFVTRDGRRPLPAWPDPDLTVTALTDTGDADLTAGGPRPAHRG
ncbi:haloacid dehalogenase type II [Gandjariella thermophila]|uniref:Haloacid dehalogenase n=1 Tax=Gandjariella thermophila TaxID=1931992 RepID=A0A4D4IW08_9PSEU|nr:haloacid dehalogenase type II [Gandjariella thermophila]GDY28535.1 haloacid dehalogenase [Gandjariella thermophila]